MGRRQGLCIGVNYGGTDHALRGCVNDADDWAALLGNNKFKVGALCEAQATKRNIVQAINKLIASLKDGDVGVITYSGHGTWVPDEEGDEPDGRDEAICPFDMGEDGENLIRGPEFKAMFDNIARGAHVVFLTDCCFSGSVYRFFNGADGTRKVRFLPPAHYIRSPAMTHRMDLGFGQPQNFKNKTPLRGLVHFSGCGDNEYSNDAHIGGRFNGAMTYFATRAVVATLKKRGSYQDAWQKIRESLPSWEFQQTPLLNASKALKKSPLFS